MAKHVKQMLLILSISLLTSLSKTSHGLRRVFTKKASKIILTR